MRSPVHRSIQATRLPMTLWPGAPISPNQGIVLWTPITWLPVHVHPRNIARTCLISAVKNIIEIRTVVAKMRLAADVALFKGIAP